MESLESRLAVGQPIVPICRKVLAPWRTQGPLLKLNVLPAALAITFAAPQKTTACLPPIVLVLVGKRRCSRTAQTGHKRCSRPNHAALRSAPTRTLLRPFARSKAMMKPPATRTGFAVEEGLKRSPQPGVRRVEGTPGDCPPA